jgi:twitching motility two-component system response regulator PilH
MSKILLVEDDPIEQRMYQNMFTSEGFEVVIVNNGKECHQKTIDVNPDIILLDMMMPEMNGLDTLDVLQFDPQTKKIPVVAFSNLSDPQYIDEAMRRGAIKFIIKSQIENKELVRTVNDIIAAYKQPAN